MSSYCKQEPIFMPLKRYLQEEERASPQHDGEQKILHGCLCHLQSKFYKRILSAVWLVSAQDQMPAMPSHHTDGEQEIEEINQKVLNINSESMKF